MKLPIDRKVLNKYYQELNLDNVREEFFPGNSGKPQIRLLNQNQKLSKSGILYGLELLPGNLNLMLENFCPGMGKCFHTCLAFSGMAMAGKKADNGISQVILKRARRTYLYQMDKEFFMQVLKAEIEFLHLWHKAKGEKFAIRLNVFSDLDWSDFIKSMPNIQFYDYTKVWSREELPNYSLTYSASEKTDTKAILSKLVHGHNVAMVFRKDLPSSYHGFTVLDGNLSDERYLDQKGLVIGLSQKTTIGGKKDSDFIFKA